MSRKKKGEKKSDEAVESTNELEAVAASEPAPEPVKTPAAAHAKAPVTKSGSRSKAAEKSAEVIPAVPIALLETYPALPDKEIILLAFAEHYSDAQTRAVRAAEEARKITAPAEQPKSRRTRYVTNPGMPTVSAPPPAPTFAPAVQVAPIAVEPEYAPLEREEPIGEPTPDAEPGYQMDDEGTPGPQAAYGSDAEDASIFGDSAVPSEDDIFAALHKPEVKDDELGFTPSSDYSDPFIRTAASSEPSDPFMPSFDQVQAAPVEEAAPHDRTMMIPAYNPPEDNEVAAEPEPEPEAEAEHANPTTGKKGRKAKKKK